MHSKTRKTLSILVVAGCTVGCLYLREAGAVDRGSTVYLFTVVAARRVGTVRGSRLPPPSAQHQERAPTNKYRPLHLRYPVCVLPPFPSACPPLARSRPALEGGLEGGLRKLHLRWAPPFATSERKGERYGSGRPARRKPPSRFALRYDGPLCAGQRYARSHSQSTHRAQALGPLFAM